MRIEIPSDTERFGAVLIHSVQKVFELDSGLLSEAEQTDTRSTLQRISYETLHNIEKEMAIIVPMRNERIKLVQGVLTGIPHHCLTIIVSNSPREPVDRFALERDAFQRFSRFIGKEVIVVHQKDLAVATAFQKVGYTQILDETTGLVKNGKAEGMILATLLARLCNRRYIGFIDADNYFPGAVLEYVHEYAAGFHLSNSPHTMVRISWHSKPKVLEDGLYFAKWGRTSRTTNKYLNMLLSEHTGFETDIIRTGNAGEHALTMDLAMTLDYSAGYSIEPYHYINLFEQFGGIAGTVLKKDMIHQPVEVFQIESRNPHMHDTDKGDEHIDLMTYAAMQVIYHSKTCPRKLKKRLLRDMRERMNLLAQEEEPLQLTYYPALANLDLDIFLDTVRERPYAQALVRAKSDLKPLSKPDRVDLSTLFPQTGPLLEPGAQIGPISKISPL
ncbi:MAG: mannosyl-3-phosphoglycerate synthase [Chloroflexota bacterium]